MQKNIETVWDKFWRNDEGKIVIWQTPSIPLIGWVVFTIVSLIVSPKNADIFQWIAAVSLLAWCLLEIFKGANYFRRLLGLVVLVINVITIINLI
jgi:hypothetical protein